MSDALKAREALRAALHQLDINVSIARRDHPEGPMVDGKRLNVDALPHSQEILAGHVKDRINDALAALSALDQPSGVRAELRALTERVRALLLVDGPASWAERLDIASRLEALSALDLSAIGAEGWRSDPMPRDQTILIAVERTNGQPVLGGQMRITHPAYVDQIGRLCDAGTCKPEPGFASKNFRTVAWRPLPSPPEPRS